jgi:Leucine-rich repeat (LRR) protein
MSTVVNAKKVTQLNQLQGDLHAVTEIDLSNKGITHFPSEILRCENLESLNLSNNGFVDLPKELGELENLEDLNLSGNQNISPFQLNELFDNCKFELTSLNLSDCALFYLPKNVGEHLSLTEIDFSSNYLKTLPYGMMRMSGLLSVNLESNRLRNISRLVPYWWSLEELNVANNLPLEGEGLLTSLSYMDKLETIKMSHLRSIPRHFKNLSATNIFLSDCHISEIRPYMHIFVILSGKQNQYLKKKDKLDRLTKWENQPYRSRKK